jgi:hypothetical protein
MPSSGDTRVEFAVLCIYRRGDLGRLGSAGLSSIEWNRGGKIRAHPHRQLIDNAATEADPNLRHNADKPAGSRHDNEYF